MKPGSYQHGPGHPRRVTLPEGFVLLSRIESKISLQSTVMHNYDAWAIAAREANALDVKPLLDAANPFTP